MGIAAYSAFEGNRGAAQRTAAQIATVFEKQNVVPRIPEAQNIAM
jgi:hypothetical protein